MSRAEVPVHPFCTRGQGEQHWHDYRLGDAVTPMAQIIHQVGKFDQPVTLAITGLGPRDGLTLDLAMWHLRREFEHLRLPSRLPDVNCGGNPAADNARAVVGAVGRILRESPTYTDTALVEAIGYVLQQSEFWTDDDWDARDERARVQGADEDPESLAYDGSNSPQRRRLTARDRDILCRVLRDIVRAGERQDSWELLMRVIRIGDSTDLPRFRELIFALDPRRD